MDVAPFILEMVLLIWFFGCIVTYKIGKRVLVDGMGVRSAEFVMLVIYAAGILTSIFYPRLGRCALLTVLLFWFIAQFFCHWYYTIFGASERKIKRYNECFRNTLRLFPQSERRLTPDLYHIVLHALILANIILSASCLLYAGG